MISFVVLIIITSARGFSSGPSQSACVDLTPSNIESFGHVGAVSEDLGFIVTAETTFRPNELLSGETASKLFFLCLLGIIQSDIYVNKHGVDMNVLLVKKLKLDCH